MRVNGGSDLARLQMLQKQAAQTRSKLDMAARELTTGLKASRFVNTLVLAVIGLTSILYAPLDIVVDVLFNTRQPSDAYLLAQLTFIPTVVWGLLWTAIALFGAAYFLLAASAAPRVKERVGGRAK